MAHIKITKGLDIPVKGKPAGDVQILNRTKPKQIALDLSPFEGVKFKLLKEVGTQVKIGDPLAEDKDFPGRFFVAPAAGIISEIKRGEKRKILNIIIDIAENEEFHEFKKIDLLTASREQIIARLKEGGIFTRIFQRPFGKLANPEKVPQAIFVKAIESAPFTPSAEMQVEGHEKEFQLGLEALSKITDGKVHLVFPKKSTFEAFVNAKNVEKHTAEGPHPIGTHSVHIQHIQPITSLDDCIFTLNAHDVVSIGYLMEKGRYFTERVIGIGGPALVDEREGFYKVREGFPIHELIEGRLPNEEIRLISGDLLTGHKVESSDFLGMHDFVFSAVAENEAREFLHFFRPGKEKYSMSKAYVSGHLNNKDRTYDFTANQHGEHRPFIVASLYDKVQPLNISTMLLVKSVMAEDFDLAEELGLLEVVPEDFALATFVCPSKMEMTDIMKNGLKQHFKEVSE
ncbi:MAG TPA: Na(+)-translocating NADH-quinone reductase subunit A [Parachlamydiaceae bacterium]|nr:Na(+)-translocating NADH-quinone reductase subunit A [Parachlamydiaceae bacterium]